MDRQQGYWVGTIIGIAGVVATILAWQLPKGNTQPPPTSPPFTSTSAPSPTPVESTTESLPGPAGSTSSPAAGGHDVPTELIGMWQGYATSRNGTFAVQLNLQQGGEGEYVGAFLIPVAGCRSDVILTAAQSAAVEVKIEVKTGACVSGNARFSLQANALGYQALGSDGQPVTGVLQRA
jgi:hypothetical protein